MRFIINSDKFEIVDRNENDNTISIKSKANNRMLFLKKEAGLLLDKTDKEYDLDSFTENMSEELTRDIKDGIILLECFDIADCHDDPRNIVKNVRVAGERDYRSIAAFIKENHEDSFGYINNWNEKEFSEDIIRARQFMNTEYYFIAREKEELKGVLIVKPPAPDSLTMILTICGAIFHKESDNDQKNALTEKLIKEAASMFSEEFCVIRYMEMSDKQQNFTEAVKKIGFEKKYVLKKETADGKDVIIYQTEIERLIND